MIAKCEKCKNENCNIPTDYEVRHFIIKIENFIVHQGIQFYKFLEYGYPRSNLKEVIKLPVAIETLRMVLGELLLFKKDKHSLCPSLFYKIKDEVLSITGALDYVRDKTVVVNEVNDEFTLDNPGCVRMENWERAIYRVAPIVNITVQKVKSEVVVPIFNIVKVDKKPIDLAFKVMKIVADKQQVGFNVSKLDSNDFGPNFSVKKVEEKSGDFNFSVSSVADNDNIISFKVFENNVSSFKVNKKIIPVDGDLENILNFIKVSSENGPNV